MNTSPQDLRVIAVAAEPSGSLRCYDVSVRFVWRAGMRFDEARVGEDAHASRGS